FEAAIQVRHIVVAQCPQGLYCQGRPTSGSAMQDDAVFRPQLGLVVGAARVRIKLQHASGGMHGAGNHPVRQLRGIPDVDECGSTCSELCLNLIWCEILDAGSGFLNELCNCLASHDSLRGFDDGDALDSVSAWSSPAKYRLGQQGLAPKGNQAFRVEVHGVDGPETHSNGHTLSGG